MEEKHVKLPSPVLSRVRPSVHFGDSTNICDLSDNDNDDEDTAETFDGQETDKAKEESTNQIIYEENNNQIPKKTSVNNNPVPIIKVRSSEGPDLRTHIIFSYI